LAENHPGITLYGETPLASSTTAQTTVPIGPTVQLPSDVQWPVQSFTSSYFNDQFELRHPSFKEYQEVKTLMGLRGAYGSDWTCEKGTRIWVVYNRKDRCIDAAAVIRPYLNSFIVAQFEVDCDQNGSTWSGRQAGKIMEGFFRDFKKASGTNLYGIVLDTNERNKKVMKKRGWKHIADLFELT
jgi:hypothetical protein